MNDLMQLRSCSMEIFCLHSSRALGIHFQLHRGVTLLVVA